ncbi:hypothetical protein P171DRAFT_437077 [Karstenula rhodostoma CBS 690.94]|uniref:Uncharacterized protein n=1 Tax=Karstenula rhodostoma CBS 690.94 TaxID=1392251 RepID=A0A9P4P8X5_9PLEO|nr:hypothetical protein P171DRAFT_437077 [Karstenula rhodostoma CBS 690.94]
MSSKSQSPVSSATTSQPKQARPKKAAVPVPAEQRAGSAGGVLLEKERTAKGSASTQTPKPTAKPTAAAATSSEVKGKDAASTPNAAASTGPNRQRRRPRKLNRDIPTDDAPSIAVLTSATPAPTTELEALKSRVRGLEAKVEELYQSSEGRNRSPRRRGKSRKNSSAQSVPTINNTSAGHEEEEADEELVRVEEELESARRDLEVYQPRSRPKGKRATSGETEYIEEIPRGDGEEVLNSEGRQVTLTGSYRIPLPATLDMKDVKTIQSGVSAAQNVAKSFLEQRRAARATWSNQATPGPASSTRSTNATAKPSKKTSSMEITKETDGKSWGEWFGGYSVAISRAVKTIEAEAAVESQRAQAGAPGEGSGTKKASGKRPTARGRQSEGAA